MINIAVLGYGTVGSGIVDILERNKEHINKIVGDEINVKYILDLKDFSGTYIQNKIIHDYTIVINDSDIKIVVEAIGGIYPAYNFTKSAFESGKHVCTSNKELVEKCGADLLEIATLNNVQYLFEASVGGGIPIIRALTECFTSDKINEINGIINGTTNYILSKMYFNGVDYNTVLKEAQQCGFAEINPEADVEGYDSCRKIAILSSIVSGHKVNYEDIYCEGITQITSKDMEYAKKLGFQIKLIAKAKEDNGLIQAIVAPFLINKEHPLYSVNGIFNAIVVKGNMSGTSMLYGSGAGKLPTAASVCSDIIKICKSCDKICNDYWDKEILKVVPIDNIKHRFLIRMSGKKCCLDSKIKEKFGQVEYFENIVNGEFAFITSFIKESEFKLKIKDFFEFIHMLRMEV